MIQIAWIAHRIFDGGLVLHSVLSTTTSGTNFGSIARNILSSVCRGGSSELLLERRTVEVFIARVEERLLCSLHQKKKLYLLFMLEVASAIHVIQSPMQRWFSSQRFFKTTTVVVAVILFIYQAHKKQNTSYTNRKITD